MLHSALITLLAAATLPSPAAPLPAVDRRSGPDPIVKVWTDWDEYSRGQSADVYVRTREDGYLIVMQADVDGRVRVLYPLDPGNDDYVRGGQEMKLPGRNNKGTFYVDGPGGTAMIYAAVSSVPFRFNDFVQGDHWDYGALYDKSMDSDFENGFTVLVDKMSTGHFDYTVYRYTVIAEASYAAAPMVTGPPVYAGSPCWATPYNPWCFGPTWIPGTYLYGPYGAWGYGYAPAVGFGVGYGYGGWSFGISFGWGCCGYGYGYPGYGYGYGYPYYGYGYPYYGYGYPHYGYPYYGYGYGAPYSPYVPKGGYPGGPTGIPYRPGVTPTPGIGLTTPWRQPGGTGTVATTGGLGLAGAGNVPHRTPTRTGWVLGRPTYAHNPNGGRAGTTSQGAGTAGAPHWAPPRYVPNAPRGGSVGGSPGGSAGGYAPRGTPTGAPVGGARPSGPAPRGAPASSPAPRGSPPPANPGPRSGGGKPPVSHGYQSEYSGARSISSGTPRSGGGGWKAAFRSSSGGHVGGGHAAGGGRASGFRSH